MYRLAVATCVGVVLAGCSSDAGSGSGPGTTQRAPSIEPAVALDGSYVVEWDGTGTKNGVPADDLNKARNGWVFRTACHDSGCVATGGSIADTANPSAPLKNVRVADYVDGRWSMVYFTENALTCDGPNGAKYTSDGWTIWDIAITPEKTLAPTVTLIGTDDCEVVNVQSLSMTRTGDPLPDFPLPDPAGQPRRSALPPAAAFNGTYTVTRTRRDRPDVQEVTNHEVQTNCLRAEARCVTTSTSSDAREPATPYQFWVYQFADRTFARRSAAAGRTCEDGRDGVATASDTLPLPSDAASAPLRTLTGERITTFTAGCDARLVEDIEYQLNSQ
jgi:hypothetical protein